MLNLLKKAERIVMLVLILAMLLVVVLSVIELCWVIIKDIVTPPVVLLEIDELLDVFGLFLLVLIGVEILATLRSYLTDHVMHAEVVVEVAMIAIARKVIILDLKEHPSLTLLGIAGIILALAVAYFIIKRRGASGEAS